MDNSCPATPLVLTETEAKSPLRIATSSPESDGMKSPSRDSPDPNCVICLGKLQNKSFTDSCLHQFCFQCLLQWSKVKAECPLCKQPFKSIINNVRSNLDYDQYPVESGEPHCVLSNFMHSFNFDFIQVDRRFRYRSTMTREYFRELAESLLARNSLIPNDLYQIPPMVPVDPAPAHNVRNSYRLLNSMRQRGTTEFRRSIYMRDLWVQDLADVSGRYRECTPQFYRENPAQIHRIVPWLNREVNVLLNDYESHSAYILTRIVSNLSQYPIRSREFRELVEPYFGSRTDHFIHELYTFSHSVYDITGFDQHAVYGPNPNYATEVQEINSSNEDSDIEILETVKCREKKFRKNSKESFKGILLKRSPRTASPQSDEPVPGPSGVRSSRSSRPRQMSDSDPEEVKILDFVKPEPEVIVLSSGEEGLCDSDGGKSECVEVVGDKREKSGRKRTNSSSDEDYVSLCEKVRNRCRSSKGKCKWNGSGLKGKQKQRYMKSRKRSRSSSTDSNGSFRSASSSTNRSISSSSSSSSSSYSSSYSLTSSSSSTNRKWKRKRSKSGRKKSKKKKKKTGRKSSHKSDKSKRRKSIDSTDDGIHPKSNNTKSSTGSTSSTSKKKKKKNKSKKRVKCCVILSSSKSCDSFNTSKTC